MTHMRKINENKKEEKIRRERTHPNITLCLERIKQNISPLNTNIYTPSTANTPGHELPSFLPKADGEEEGFVPQKPSTTVLFISNKGKEAGKGNAGGNVAPKRKKATTFDIWNLD